MLKKWNDFFTALIYIRKDALKPLQIILRDILLANQVFAQGAGTGGATIGGAGYAQKYADQVKYGIIIVSTLPILMFYPFIQKYFEKGIMIGAELTKLDDKTFTLLTNKEVIHLIMDSKDAVQIDNT